MRPAVPSSERSARSWPWVSGLPTSNPWMSFGVSPSPMPLSGSLLVVDLSTKAAGPDPSSVTTRETVTSTMLWFGGHNTGGLAAQVENFGAVWSILNDVDLSDSTLPALSTER